jgi:hypothetical protein
MRTNKAAKQLKNQLGFDKEGHKLFDPNEIAKRNFLAQRLRAKENATPDSMYRDVTDVTIAAGASNGDQSERNNSSNSLDDLDKMKMPRTIQTVVIYFVFHSLSHIKFLNG